MTKSKAIADAILLSVREKSVAVIVIDWLNDYEPTYDVLLEENYLGNEEYIVARVEDGILLCDCD